MNFKEWFYEIEEMYSSKGKGHPFKPGPRDNPPKKPHPSPKDPTPRSLAGQTKLCGQGGGAGPCDGGGGGGGGAAPAGGGGAAPAAAPAAPPS